MDQRDDMGCRHEYNPDDYEKEYAYRAVWMTLADMIRKNEAVKDCGKIPWIKVCLSDNRIGANCNINRDYDAKSMQL